MDGGRIELPTTTPRVPPPDGGRIAFALVEEWGAAGRERAPMTPADADRRVYPACWQDGGLTLIVDAIMVAYDDEVDAVMQQVPRRRAGDRSILPERGPLT